MPLASLMGSAVLCSGSTGDNWNQFFSVQGIPSFSSHCPNPCHLNSMQMHETAVDFFLLIINNNDNYQYNKAFLKYHPIGPNQLFPHWVLLFTQTSVYSVFAYGFLHPTSLFRGGIFSVFLFQNKGREKEVSTRMEKLCTILRNEIG